MRTVLVILTAVTLSACSGSIFEKDTEVRSPCVAIDPQFSHEAPAHKQTPCSRRPANAHWIS